MNCMTTTTETNNNLKAIGASFRNEIIDLWKTKDSEDYIYFTQGEMDNWLAAFWKEDSVFLKLFKQLNITRCAEIACGFGRHSSQIYNKCQELYLIDTSIDATNYARERFKSSPHVKVFLSYDGLSMPGIADESLTSVFSYDAMVHFEPLTITAYLSEIARTLVQGGRALLHHSNYSGNPTGKIEDVEGARNYMTQSLFAHLCSRNNLTVISQEILDWSFKESDALSLIEKM